MTDFPSLIPSRRIFSPGDYPNTPYQSINGTETRVRNSNVLLNSSLQLEFIGLSESDVLAVLLHYQARRGPYGNFALPPEIFSGTSNPSDYSLQSYAWSYVEAPTVEDYPCGSHALSVKLESSPAPAADVLSFATTITVGNAAGKAAAANGLMQALTLTLARSGMPSVIINVPSIVATFRLRCPNS